MSGAKIVAAISYSGPNTVVKFIFALNCQKR